MEIKHNQKNTKRGFTLIELVVYAAGMVLLVGAIAGTLYVIYGWYTTATVIPRTDRIGMAVADQLVRTIRSGSSVTGGTFGSNNSSMTLSTLEGGVSGTEYIALSGGRIVDQRNSGAIQYLSPSDTTVSRLRLTQITTPVSSAVRFEMDITYAIRGATSTRTYSGVAILRNSY